MRACHCTSLIEELANYKDDLPKFIVRQCGRGLEIEFEVDDEGIAILSNGIMIVAAREIGLRDPKLIKEGNKRIYRFI